MRLLFLYGLPGVGKLTVARKLSELTGCKLFHNHLTVDLLLSVFDFGSPEFVELRETIWLSVFETAVEINLPTMIFTFNPENTVRQEFIDKTVRMISSQGGKVTFVEVTCEPAELERRLDTPDRRRHKKLISIELFRRLKANGTFDSPVLPPPELTVNTTSESPTQIAMQIARDLKLPLAGATN
jgi:hypothetical protein